MADKIRWGIISTARIGRTAVIPSIHESSNGEVVAVGSRDLAKGQAFASETNIPRVHGSYEALLADPEIDAVYNPLPNDMHGEWSLRALEAGKAVLCEKPLTGDAAEAQALVDAFAAKGVLLAEAFMYRFHPQTLRVREMAQSGELGKIQSISSTFSFPIGNEQDIRLFGSMAGGALMDIGCYCVGVMRFITGEEPVSVQAYADINDRGADERATGILEFPSGVLGHFDCSMRSYFTQHYEVIGTKGRVKVEEAFVIPRTTSSRIRYWHDNTYEEIEIPAVNQYRLMVEDFSDSLLNNRPPLYPAQDSVHAMVLLDKLRAAGRDNQRG